MKTSPDGVAGEVKEQNDSRVGHVGQEIADAYHPRWKLKQHIVDVVGQRNQGDNDEEHYGD